MTLHELVQVLRKRWLMVGIITLLAVGAATARSVTTPPTYQATAGTFVTASAGAQTGIASQGSQFALQRVASYVAVASSTLVLEPVAEELGGTTTARSLRSAVSASNPNGTVMIDITATSGDPEVAARTANAVAQSFSRAVERLERTDASQPSPVMVTVIEPATVPRFRIAPRTTVDVVVAAVVGLFVGTGAALLRHHLDTRLRTALDVRATTGRAPLTATVRDKRAAVVEVDPTRQTHWSEAHRGLRDKLALLDVDDPPRSFVVTSANPAEGKSTSSVGLAVAMAQSGARVVLVDGDLRSPSVAERLGLEGGVGLVDVLAGRLSVQDALQESVHPSLRVLCAGPVPPDPGALLGSRRMRELLERLREDFDAVVIDAPPVLPVPDALVMAALVDGVLLVARSGRTRSQDLTSAVDQLATARGRVLGVLLAAVPRRETEERYYGAPVVRRRRGLGSGRRGLASGAAR
ncbi:polysaccharide biosynthesis tyrosine autokinase [Quadrisphaera setariae]|uniref:non-specific protein-tyrosine kinase n=1 Tax=Quadrisphaera setariae TaxID=2593304 RepID=A0A5C8ZE95_9ACTN|nr:polysaccharide biosynthesis tyrosine autokinase [Quadrisphaera setariae]TXR56375.1 polysaccharide biosynthesis tyrosine autokinase [Quadrisphaera setariae]